MRIRILPTIEPLSTLTADADFSAMTWSPDGAHIASQFGGVVWDGEAGEMVVSTDGTDADWSPDGSQILTVTGGTVLIWPAP